MKIKFLKAFKGDCILISFEDEKNVPRNILIDGGMDGTYYDVLNNQYGELKEEIDKIKAINQKIDLLILTHIDNDHICGLLKWFEMDNKAYEIVENVWFNSGKLIARHLKEPENADLRVGLKIFNSANTGVNEAIEFEEYLKEKKIWDEKLVVQSTSLKENGVNIQILSPNEIQLKKLLREYKAKTGDAAYTAGSKIDWKTDLKTFIEEEQSESFEFKQDTSLKNASSITFILNAQNSNFVFLADAPPKEIVKQLKKLGYCKEKPLEAELLKLSHHGSKSNTNKELLEIIKTDNYFISTDSSSHGHPNKRTLARIISVNPNAIFHFNYRYVKKEIFSKNDFNDYKFTAKVTSEYTV